MDFILTVGLCAINLAAFSLVYWDKQQSRSLSRRIPEVHFFVWAVLFGSFGVWLGMLIFHHKNLKLTFQIGIGFLMLEQLALLFLLLQK